MPDPNFFIVGAARAGTTSLYRTLQQHPDVFMPEYKEPNYFCHPIPGWEAFTVPESRDLNAYLRLFEPGATRAAIGEASVSYLTDPESARRIYDFNPQARVIIMLRHPADRAFSMYRYMCMRGFERQPTFEDALADESVRLARAAAGSSIPYLYAGCYFDSGLYSAQIERFTRTFPREQIHVVLLDDFKSRPAETAREVFGFLGIDADLPVDVAHRNASPFVLSVHAQHFLARHWHLHPQRKPGSRFRPLIDRPLIPLAFILNAQLGRLRTNRMRPDTRRSLSRRYREDIERTADVIGRNLDRWLEGADPLDEQVPSRRHA